LESTSFTDTGRKQVQDGKGRGRDDQQSFRALQNNVMKMVCTVGRDRCDSGLRAVSKSLTQSRNVSRPQHRRYTDRTSSHHVRCQGTGKRKGSAEASQSKSNHARVARGRHPKTTDELMMDVPIVDNSRELIRYAWPSLWAKRTGDEYSMQNYAGSFAPPPLFVSAQIWVVLGKASARE
jgi:hypothetical protein